jgi:hypothetical protein
MDLSVFMNCKIELATTWYYVPSEMEMYYLAV